MVQVGIGWLLYFVYYASSGRNSQHPESRVVVSINHPWSNFHPPNDIGIETFSYL